jgi:flagellar biosynthesis/type III secretory pathway chaperone
MLQVREPGPNGRFPIVGKPPDIAPMVDAILQVVERIENVLTEEQTLVSQSEFADIETLIARKSHLALELSRLMEHAQHAMSNEAVCRSIEKLKANLSENAQLLRRHMDAVCEISSLVAEAIQSASADGTYSNQPNQPGPKSWSR